MRRTQAPSQIPSRKKADKESLKPFPEASRSTSQLLSLLSDTPCTEFVSLKPEESVSSHSEVDAAVCVGLSPERCDNVKKYYGVVWGKQTKKKHKTWEGDGTLVVENDSATLKDQNGSVLGRCSKLKMHTLEEGCRLLVGSKEVEIIDVINQSNTAEIVPSQQSDGAEEIVKRKISDISNAPLRKPLKRLKTNASNYKSPLNVSNTECLMMPKPDHAHQWKYNKNQLPIIDVAMDLFLTRLLRPHQKQGVLFLYSCVSGIRDADYTGAILADEMGLGKTLQCIALIWMLLKTGPYGAVPLVQRVLIVTPSSLVTNWLKEFKQWLTFQRLQPFVVNQKQKPSDYATLPATKSPVMIISYEMLMRYYDDVSSMKFQLMICDEGHRLKNNQSRISILLSKLSIEKKILLTGTPVQNNLQEFYALIEFVNPGIVGTYAEFRKYFELPIVLSNQPECCDETKELGVARSRELNQKTNSFILRRTQSIIDQYLPSKQECVIFCSPLNLQIKLYEAVISFWENNLLEDAIKVPHLNVITMLKKICNHPKLVKYEKMNNNSGEDAVPCTFEETFSDVLESVFRNNKNEEELEMSSKMLVLDKFLSELTRQNERVVLISYFTQTLDLFEELCSKRRYSYLRLDGSTSVAFRNEAVEKFNAVNSKYFIFLLSAKAGGVGLNLIGASRLILFDLDWNPASDLQAMSRIWRDGQRRNVYIYRFLTSGTIEEKIYQRQISKTFLSNAVVDIQTGSNVRMSNEELKDLFNFRPDCASLTHDMLMCECSGDGVPEINIDDKNEGNNERDSQLAIFQQHRTKSISKISELIEWEHFSSPIADSVLNELCLKSAANNISFIFRNKHAQFTSSQNDQNLCQ